MRDGNIALSLKYLVFMYYGFGGFYLLATIFIYFFRMDSIRVCVIYELGMIVWFVLYYVIDPAFRFVDFYTFIMMTVELGIYIYYTIQVMRCTCYDYIFNKNYNLWLMVFVGLFDRFLFPMLMVSSLCWITC